MKGFLYRHFRQFSTIQNIQKVTKVDLILILVRSQFSFVYFKWCDGVSA